jgi:polyisoprenoid-binding protein YceI
VNSVRSSRRLRVLTFLVSVCWTLFCLNASAADNPTQPNASIATPSLPAPGTYKIDFNHSFAYFGARHHVVGLVRGRFDKVTGTILSAKDPADCSVDIVIEAASVSTQNTERDEDLRSKEYFDVKQFPQMTYRGHGIHRSAGNTWTMDGSLTLHGVTKIVPLRFTFNGIFAGIPADKQARAAFHGTAVTKRVLYNIGARDNLEELGLLKTPDVEIQIDVEADANAPSK